MFRITIALYWKCIILKAQDKIFCNEYPKSTLAVSVDIFAKIRACFWCTWWFNKAYIFLKGREERKKGNFSYCMKRSSTQVLSSCLMEESSWEAAVQAELCAQSYQHCKEECWRSREHLTQIRTSPGSGEKTGDKQYTGTRGQRLLALLAQQVQAQKLLEAGGERFIWNAPEAGITTTFPKQLMHHCLHTPGTFVKSNLRNTS